MLTPRRAAAAGAVACAAALVLHAGAPAYASAAPAVVRAADTVGGPDLAAKGIVVHRLAGSTRLPAVQAESWVLADLTTGEVLAAKDAHRRALPASMLKTLTAVTLMPTLDKARVVTATYDQARADGGHVGIVPGATYSIWDLWHGLLLPSANDAAAALADANGGMATTVSQMQATAAHLNARDTTVRNDSGLDAPGQLSSAYDMALFARAGMQIPDFAKVTATVSYDFPGRPVKAGQKRSTYKIYSQNRLLLHGYDGTIGGKTGFTSLAHRTFWGAATRDGHTLVVTLFQIKDPTEKAARALLDWGFANVGKVTPVGTLVDPGEPTPNTPTASPTAVASAPATSGGTSAAGTSPSGSRLSVPWLPVGLVVVVLAALGLWWRRRSGAGTPWQSLPEESGAATVLPAPASPAARPAAHRTSSVVVTTPAPRTPAGTGSPKTSAEPASLPIQAEDVTGPVPVVAGPVATPPVAAAPETAAPEAVSPEATSPGVTPPATPPSPGGHVRVIRPPSRPS